MVHSEDWQCLYQYPDDEGAAFDYMGSEVSPSQPIYFYNSTHYPPFLAIYLDLNLFLIGV